MLYRCYLISPSQIPDEMGSTNIALLIKKNKQLRLRKVISISIVYGKCYERDLNNKINLMGHSTEKSGDRCRSQAWSKTLTHVNTFPISLSHSVSAVLVLALEATLSLPETLAASLGPHISLCFRVICVPHPSRWDSFSHQLLLSHIFFPELSMCDDGGELVLGSVDQVPHSWCCWVKGISQKLAEFLKGIFGYCW